jgi:tRNA dimethylallyltransferase
MTDTKPKIIIICGPTATGKSDLAVDMALFIKNLNLKKTTGDPTLSSHLYHAEAEIVSADSRQVYIGLDVGTGKITHEEMKGVPHHMLSIVEPLKTYSVAEYKRDAERAIEQILDRGNIPIICGGTGQYIDAVIFNLSLPEVAPDDKLRADLETKSIEELTEIFNNLNKDKDGNAQLHSVDMQNKRRIIRAIEILKELGYIPPITKDERFDTLWIGIDTDDETIKSRISRRLDSRLQTGMIEESQRLLEGSKLTQERMQKLGLEYAYIADFLATPGTAADLTEFKSSLNMSIWHYAKRQRTWFRRNPDVHWLMTGDVNPMATDEVKERAFGLVRDFLI